ncbi:MAG: hypothetical protein ABWY81_09720, partial [Jiangellaceae bacterium]
MEDAGPSTGELGAGARDGVGTLVGFGFGVGVAGSSVSGTGAACSDASGLGVVGAGVLELGPPGVGGAVAARAGGAVRPSTSAALTAT